MFDLNKPPPTQSPEEPDPQLPSNPINPRIQQHHPPIPYKRRGRKRKYENLDEKAEKGLETKRIRNISNYSKMKEFLKSSNEIENQMAKDYFEKRKIASKKFNYNYIQRKRTNEMTDQDKLFQKSKKETDKRFHERNKNRINLERRIRKFKKKQKQDQEKNQNQIDLNT